MLRLLLLSSLLGLGSCSALVGYTDDLVDNKTGRSNFVTKPASVMGVVGFVVGVPFDILALPVTYTIYQTQKSDEMDGIDPLSTLLFPSFVLWRTGVLAIGAPLDGLEFGFYRVWTRDTEGSREEYERDLEELLDDKDEESEGGALGAVDPRDEARRVQGQAL